MDVGKHLDPDHIDKRISELMLFTIPLHSDLMDQIFCFDPNTLESTKSLDISKYVIGLSSFLVFFQSQVNMSKMLLVKKKKILNDFINQCKASGGTKEERRINAINSDEEAKLLAYDIELLEQENILTEGLIEGYIEMINAFKRELTRREQEGRYGRDERRY
jgi:hypothetical protein